MTSCVVSGCLLRGFALAVSLLALAGCERTVFQNPPTAAAECDPALIGTWLSEGDTRKDDGEITAIVGPACDLVTIERREDNERKSEPTKLHTARVGGVRYLWLDAAWANRSFEAAPHPLDQPGDVYLYAYNISRDVLRLGVPPHRAIAHRILDKDIPGEVSMREDELIVRITGDTDSVRETLRKHRIFRMDEATRFRRAPQAASP